MPVSDNCQDTLPASGTSEPPPRPPPTCMLCVHYKLTSTSPESTGVFNLRP